MLITKDSTKIPQTQPPCDFPSDVLKWMKKNTSNPRKSLKLMQICKYFQMESFKNYNHVCTVCEKYISKRDFIKHKIIDYKVEDFKDLPYKFWITHDLTSLSPDFDLSLLISKIAVCEAKKIIINSQKLLYDEFKILVGGNCVEILDFISTTLKYSKNGTDVSFEDFIGLLPKVKKIYFTDHVPTFNSLDAINAATPLTLEKVTINSFPKKFCLRNFFQYMDDHQNIFFHILHREKYYTKKMQSFINRVIERGPTNHRPPYISFYGQDQKSCTALNNLRKSYEANNPQNSNVFE